MAQILLLSVVIAAGTTFITMAHAQIDAESPSMDIGDIPDRENVIPIPLDLLTFFEGGDEEIDIRQFDLENGLAPEAWFIHVDEWIASWNPLGNDASTFFGISIIIDNVGFDAVAPYHPTAVGIYSRIENRPASESETNLNPNLAVTHAYYQVLIKIAPERADVWRQVVEQLGLDPDDTSGLDLNCNQKHNLYSPVAIGNLAAKCVIEGRQHDGFNRFGYETGGERMADTTGFTTVNTPYELVDPSRWQPLVVQAGGHLGKYAAQHFVTPQYANTEPYSGLDPRSHRVPPPIYSNHEYADLYKAQTDEVLELTAHLNDTQKVLIEFFDNKARPEPVFQLSPKLAEIISQLFLTDMAQFDAGILAWQEKARYDAVRPVTAIGYLYGDEPVKVTSMARSVMSEIPANQWYSYVTTGDHPEYPSGTTCYCAAFAETARLYTGSDTIYDYQLPNGEILPGYTVEIEAGSSLYEPGITPAEDMIISFGSWTEYEQKCANSRVLGGVHFKAAVDEAINLCRAAAQPAYEYWQSLMNGTAPVRSPAQPLDLDPLLDIPHWTGR